MTRKFLRLLCALATVAGCDLATKTDWEGPVAACKSAGPTPAACVENSECCSYACVSGVCAPGETLGAVCQTTYDCGTNPSSWSCRREALGTLAAGPCTIARRV